MEARQTARNVDTNAAKENNESRVEVPPELTAFILSGTKFLVGGHNEPDGDCIGSQLALVSLLRRLGKEAIPCSAGPFKRSEIKAYEPLFCAAPGEEQRRGARVILTDCSSPGRTGDLEPFLKGLPLALIDHHAVCWRSGEEAPRGPVYLDSEAPASTLLIQRLAEALNLELTPEEAKLLFFGLCTDTGFFRHVDKHGVEILEAAAKLLKAGASLKAAYLDINGGKSLNSRILMGRVLSRCESLFGGRLILSTEEYEETRRFGAEGRDSDGLYQLLQTVAGMEAIAIIRQESPGRCAVGLRSRDEADVGALAASLGGGGHKNAAGVLIEGTIAGVRPVVIEAFAKIFGPG